jgi:hypothetical protein
VAEEGYVKNLPEKKIGKHRKMKESGLKIVETGLNLLDWVGLNLIKGLIVQITISKVSLRAKQSSSI